MVTENLRDAKFCMVCHLPPDDNALAEKMAKERATQQFLELAGLVGEMGERKIELLRELIESIDKKDLPKLAKEYGLKIDNSN